MELLVWCVITIAWIALVVGIRGLVEVIWRRVSFEAAECILAWIFFALVVVAAVLS